LLGSLQQREAGAGRRIGGRSRLAGFEAGTAVLANDLFAKVFHANLQVSPASRAFLHKVGASRHDGISCYRRDPPPIRAMAIQYKRPVGEINNLDPNRLSKKALAAS
jgi:hypothetical protein